MQQPTSRDTILALDVGSVRIGVARANIVARLPEPLTTLIMSDKIHAAIAELIDEHKAGLLVVGLPRSLASTETQQTKSVRQFAEDLKNHIHIPIFFQEEALTSQKAQEHLQSKKYRGKPPTIDELAATYILEDYLAEHMTKENS
ncbi:MAG: Holliday junction resolvase RuvX [Candidatus Saccharibacteria bacterium]|nr:Holliday junction resolvase RuvX [Candidatus Saccharibacteria bacterium]